MDRRQLEVFGLIVETGSFSVAARRLNLTQSAVSHNMRMLEEEIGEALVVRARPRIYATPAGQSVLASAERILGELEQIKAHFGSTRKSATNGTVRVCATHLAMTYVYGELLDHFTARHPEVDLVFHATETTDDPVQRVLQRHADVGFSVLPIKHPQLRTLPLFRAEQVFIVSPKHPLAKQKITTVEELRQWPFARFEAGSGGRKVSDSLFATGAHPPVLAESNEVEYLKRIIRIGSGVALVPVFCLRNELAKGTLQALRLRSGRILQPAGMVVRKDTNIRALDLFKSVCVELRGRRLRTITLESVERPLFEAI